MLLAIATAHAPMDKLIIITNSQKLRAFRVVSAAMESPNASSHFEELLVEFSPPSPAATDASDDDGNFPSGFTRGGAPMRHGESHGRQEEEERRNVEALAAAITDIVAAGPSAAWELAAPKRICKRVVESLSDNVRERLSRVEEADYTGEHQQVIKQRFGS